MREYLDRLDGHIQIAFLPPYAPDINPVEYLWAWLKRHALANYCPNNLSELRSTARNKLQCAQKRPSIIAACWIHRAIAFTPECGGRAVKRGNRGDALRF